MFLFYCVFCVGVIVIFVFIVLHVCTIMFGQAQQILLSPSSLNKLCSQLLLSHSSLTFYSLSTVYLHLPHSLNKLYSQLQSTLTFDSLSIARSQTDLRFDEDAPR